jgi:hypothetical protein
MRNWLHGFLGARLHLGISRHSLVLRRTAGWRAHATPIAELPLTEEAIAEPQRLILQCTSMLANANCAGLPFCVTVADELTRLFIVTPPHNASRLHDLHAAASMRFAALYGDSLSAWNLQADWNVNAPFLACALPHTLLSALQQVAAHNQLPLLSITPSFAAAWNQYRNTVPPDAWFGVVQDHSLTLGAITPTPKRRLEAVRNIAIPDNGHSLNWLQEQLSRAALQLNLPSPQQIQLVGNNRHWWGGVHSDAAAKVSTLAVPA